VRCSSSHQGDRCRRVRHEARAHPSCVFAGSVAGGGGYHSGSGDRCGVDGTVSTERIGAELETPCIPCYSCCRVTDHRGLLPTALTTSDPTIRTWSARDNKPVARIIGLQTPQLLSCQW
jgi:hypothetical protein